MVIMVYPSLYEYYTSPRIVAGLSERNPYFTLNNKNITIYSGALHYFRVPPAYWRDRLRKFRAAGLNAVETYIPWNLHEPKKETFDFGQGGTDFEAFLNIEMFLKLAQEEDLLVIVRPGPYICAEWEFGGLPSWLLREKPMKIRTSDQKFIGFVQKYFNRLLPILSKLQFTNGGPIVAFQIENEYGNTRKNNEPVDIEYLNILRQTFIDNGIVELLFTSDTPSNGFHGTLPGILATANFQSDAKKELDLLRRFQPNKPLMVMEYWTGWFDHWTERHHTRTVDDFGDVLEEILDLGSSVNMYMFHGGTNWGFMNGGNIKDSTTDNSAYQSDTTSYDYDAPLSESGDYTDKYYKVKALIEKYNQIKTMIPDMPQIIPAIAYETINIIGKLNINDLTKLINPVKSQNPLPMELLPINNNNGQSYGYIVYRKQQTIPSNGILKIKGHVCDTVLVLINGMLMSKILETTNDLSEFGYWRLNDATLNLNNSTELINATIELIVENFGRSNYGKLDQFNQYKGLWQGDVLINDHIMENWEMIPVEFKTKFCNSLTDWREVDDGLLNGPALYKGILNIDNDNVRDTYIDMRGWNKGVLIVNGFVLGRYMKLGPQLATFLPAPFLHRGENTILIFEHFISNREIQFSDKPIFITE